MFLLAKDDILQTQAESWSQSIRSEATSVLFSAWIYLPLAIISTLVCLFSYVSEVWLLEIFNKKYFDHYPIYPLGGLDGLVSCFNVPSSNSDPHEAYGNTIYAI